MIIVLCKKKADQRPFAEWFQELAEPIAVVHPESEQLATDVGVDGSSCWSIPLKEYANNGAVESIVLNLARQHAISRIVSFSESDVLRAAALRKKLAIPGQSLESAFAYRNKLAMKSHLVERGVPVPEHAGLRTVLDALDFAENHGWPIVVKPISLAGSRDISLLSSREELAAWARQTCAGPGMVSSFMVETYVDAAMYHVDGLMHGGIVDWAMVSEYLSPPLETLLQDTPIGGVTLDQRHAEAHSVLNIVRATVAALPGPNETTSFHAEIFRDRLGRLSVCEIASRTAGPRIAEMITDYTGIDLDHESARGQAGLRPKGVRTIAQPKGASGWFLFPPKQGRLTACPAACPLPWVSRYERTARIGQLFGGRRKTSEHIAWAIVRGSSSNTVKERLLELGVWFDENVGWA